MLESIWLVPVLPAFSALLLMLRPLLSNSQYKPLFVTIQAVGVIGVGFVITVLSALEFNELEPNYVVVSLGQWISVNDFEVSFNFYIDALTLTMMSIITGVGCLIHWFSSGYMEGDESFSRYFAYLNLFVSAMLVLVMADNLLLLYLGWEGVGLCSFMLIGFWYKKPENGYAARKAFVVTRVGDTAMAIGLFLLFTQLGSLNIQTSMQLATEAWGDDNSMATIIALLLLGGAVGKSAQLPLQTWLPDAMAGPTPVSALIHAATMVTAGVYLIDRTHAVFELSSFAMAAVATIGAFTLFTAGCSALVQTDIKRILAYSTMSQIGYMFYALGVGAWDAGTFHLMTHAFFKALLFLAAGLVIISLHHKQDIFEMGGLRKKLPVSFWSFMIGCACLAALPMTSGYFSKDAILVQAYENNGIDTLWIMAWSGALLTGLYSFRLIFVVFFGEENKTATEKPHWSMRIPLFILCILALAGGLLHPDLHNVFNFEPRNDEHGPIIFVISAAPIIGIFIAYLIWGRGMVPATPRYLQGLKKFLLAGWGFDNLYDILLIKPLTKLSQINRNDIVDSFYILLSALSYRLHNNLSATQNGQLRWFVAATAGGAIIIMALVML